MSTRSVIAALGGGAIGALGWGLLAWLLNIELGYAAIGVGILAGGASMLAGGRGTANGLICAAIALAAIFAGKVLASVWMTKVLPGAAGLSWADHARYVSSDLDLFDLVFAGVGFVFAFQAGKGQDREPKNPETPVAV